MSRTRTPVGVAARLRRSAVALAVGLSFSLVVAACSTPSSSTSSSTSTTGSSSTPTATSSAVAQAQAALQQFLAAPTTITQTTPLPSTPPKGKTVVWVGTSEPSNVQEQTVGAAAARALGWNFSVVDFDPANPATLDAAFLTALAKHPVGVFESGTPQSQIASNVLSAYASAGVPIVLSASYPFTQTSTVLGNPDSYANDARMGDAMADWFVIDSGGAGKVILEHVPGYPILNAFTDTFKSDVAKLCPACSVKEVDVTLPEVAAGQTVSVVTSAVRSNPSYKYVFFDDGDFAIGINSALSAAGITGEKIGGEALDAQGAAALRSGTQSAWTAFSAYYTAYASFDVLLRWIEHAPGAAADGVQPTQVLTPSNIGSTTVWNAPTNALAQFEMLWKVPVTPCPAACS
jgi:ribose transport system substrate-binding protein